MNSDFQNPQHQYLNLGHPGPPLTFQTVQPESVQQKPEIKNRSSLIKLAWGLMAMAVIEFLLDVVVIIIIFQSQAPHYYYSFCSFGTGIWVGILGIITAGLGVGAFRPLDGNKCLMISNF